MDRLNTTHNLVRVNNLIDIKILVSLVSTKCMYLISYMRVAFGPCKGDDDFVLCSDARRSY